MEDTERRLERVEASVQALLNRIESKLDQVVSLSSDLTHVKARTEENKTSISAAFNRVDSLRDELEEQKRWSMSRWSMARGAGLAALVFWTISQLVVSYMVSDYVGTAKADHEFIVTHRAEDEARKDARDSMGQHGMNGGLTWRQSTQPKD